MCLKEFHFKSLGQSSRSLASSHVRDLHADRTIESSLGFILVECAYGAQSRNALVVEGQTVFL